MRVHGEASHCSGIHGHIRARAGVLLPKNAPTHGLPVYEGTPRPHRGPPGTRWGDADLENEARKLRADKK